MSKNYSIKTPQYLKPSAVHDDSTEMEDDDNDDAVESSNRTPSPSHLYSDYIEPSRSTTPIDAQQIAEALAYKSDEDPSYDPPSRLDKRSKDFWRVKRRYLNDQQILWLIDTPRRTRKFSKDLSAQLEQAFRNQRRSFPLSDVASVNFNVMTIDIKLPGVDSTYTAKIQRHSKAWESKKLLGIPPDDMFDQIQLIADRLNSVVHKDEVNQITSIQGPIDAVESLSMVVGSCLTVAAHSECVQDEEMSDKGI